MRCRKIITPLKTSIYLLAIQPILGFGHAVLIKSDSFYLDQAIPINLQVFCGDSMSESEISIQPDSVETMFLKGPETIQDYERTSLKPYVTGSIPWRIWQKVKGSLGAEDLRRVSKLSVTPEEEGSHVFAMRLFKYRLAKTPETFHEWLMEAHMQDETIASLPEKLGKTDLTGSYIKCIKSIIQVGESITDDAIQPVDLPIEIVPTSNPASMKKKQVMRFKVLLLGEPLANQIVSAAQRTGPFNYGDGNLQVVRTDKNGEFEINLVDKGIWGLKVIHVISDTDQAELDYQTYSGTLTIEII